MPQELTLKVNGQSHRVTAEPDTPLLIILRNDLGLKGAKFGCGLAQCGACTVIVDGEAVRSCRYPVGAAEGREIITVEGLGTPEQLHPVQAAFVAEGAAQCGFCTAGLVVAAAALLDRNPHPSDDEIRGALSGNLCRCGVYDRALRAVRRAAGHPGDQPPYQVEVRRDQEPPDESISPGLPDSLQETPELDSWVRIDPGGTITLFTGKAELGQDICTSVAMIGAEELDVPLERVRVIDADTAVTADEGYTDGSMSMESTGNAMRYAAAEVRQLALQAAGEELEAPIERLTIVDGTINDPATGRSTTYWDLFAGHPFGMQIRGIGRPKRPKDHTVVGTPVTRRDLLDKVTGQFRFVQDMELPGMLHGRVLRPPHYAARLASVDERAVRAMPGVVQVVCDGSFLGVVAEREEQAVRALEVLRENATWQGGPDLPPQEGLPDYLPQQVDETSLIVKGSPEDEPVPSIQAPAGAAQTLSGTYYRPHLMHASLGPSAAVAHLEDGSLTVWTHSQGVYPLRGALASVLGMPEDAVHAIHMDGPGCYGHNGADDAALDAALLARAVPGRPVSVQWSRRDEHTWEPYGTATVLRLQASLDQAGSVIDWNHDVWGHSHGSRAFGPGGTTSGLLAAWHLAEPFERPQPFSMQFPQGGLQRNADPLYTFPRRRIVKHFIPDSALRVSALRSLGANANIFAIESFMDELAHAAGVDPVAFRLRHLDDSRARAVIQAAADKAGWRAGERLPGEDRGRGIAFAQYKNRQTYVAVVAEVSVVRASGHIRLERLVIAADAGQIVSPDGLSNQLEGSAVQSASWALKEHVTFGPEGITSVDWRTYPIMRLRDAPAVESVLLNRPDWPFVGAGEAAQGPSTAAVANAVFDAVGARLRAMPFTPERVKAALT